MALRLAAAADAPNLSVARNAWATLRPDIYGAPAYTPEQALADITAGAQRVFVYETGTPAVLRGMIIVSEQPWYDPDTQHESMALRIGDFAIDPALFSVSVLQTAMQALKNWAQNNRPPLRRLCGEALEPSPIYTYLSAAGWRTVSSKDNGDGTITHLLDRIFTVGIG